MPEHIKKLRRNLHQYPELSGEEVVTANIIKTFIESHCSAKIIERIGGYGIAAVFSFEDEGPSIVIRCELDAVEINEQNKLEYRSLKSGVSHKCGHDGHMAIVAGLVFWIEKQHFEKGSIILLFQPAEETGKGALNIINDDKFRDLNPDYFFALHNIPGEALNTIILAEERFSSTVESVAIFLKGKEAHAAEPENGLNPSMLMAEIIEKLARLNNTDAKGEIFSLLTPVCINMGKKSYGISPGEAELHYTLRSSDDKKMQWLKDDFNKVLYDSCSKYGLAFHTEWFDFFPVSINNPFCNKVVYNAAKQNGLEIVRRPGPFRFGEDFAWYSKKYPCSMFGLGAGIDSPSLHQADYDFPDEILETGIRMFSRIIEQILR